MRWLQIGTFMAIGIITYLIALVTTAMYLRWREARRIEEEVDRFRV